MAMKIEAGDQIAKAGRLRAHAERVDENRPGLREQRVEVAVLDESAEMADAAGQRHRQSERRRDQAEQHLDVAQPPATDRRHASP